MSAHEIRRVVAQHDGSGRATFSSDTALEMTPIGGAGSFNATIWATDRAPADNMDPRDLAAELKGLGMDGGTAFRILDVSPDEATPMHRTVTLDYVIITKGEIDLELDSGETRTLRTGDVMIQRGTNHRWINRSGEWTQMVAILISAKPVEVDGMILDEVHI